MFYPEFFTSASVFGFPDCQEKDKIFSVTVVSQGGGSYGIQFGMH